MLSVRKGKVGLKHGREQEVWDLAAPQVFPSSTTELYQQEEIKIQVINIRISVC